MNPPSNKEEEFIKEYEKCEACDENQSRRPEQQRKEEVCEDQPTCDKEREVNISKTPAKHHQHKQQQHHRSKYTTVSIRHNFTEEVENGINELINTFYFGAYTCRSMQFYFDRDNIGMFGMAKLNKYNADCQLEFVRKLEDYQVVRGGRVCLAEIKKPEKDEWNTPIDSLTYLINMKRSQVEQCLKLYEVCEKSSDEHLKEYLEIEFLEPLYNSIRTMGVLVTNGQRAGQGLGEYEFNKDVMKYLESIKHARKIKHDVRSSSLYAERSERNVMGDLMARLNIVGGVDLVKELKRIF